MDLGKLGVWYFFDGLTSADAAKAAQRIEALGYGTLWLPETVGKSPFVMASWMLANTTKLNLATGIVNIYHREPGVTMAAQKSLAEQSGGRFLLGMGVSHKPLVEGVRGPGGGYRLARPASQISVADIIQQPPPHRTRRSHSTDIVQPHIPLVTVAIIGVGKAPRRVVLLKHQHALAEA